MCASSWMRHLPRRWFPRRAIHRAPVRPRPGPCLEVLEDRTAPFVPVDPGGAAEGRKIVKPLA
jgi:hypothetical protein